MQRKTSAAPRVLAIAVAIAIAVFGSVSVPASAGAGGSRLLVGEQLTEGQQLVSPNGGFRLTLQTDNNLVLYGPDNRLSGTIRKNWSTQGSGANRLVFQADGNLVLYTASNVALWESQTDGEGGSRVEMQDDGNIVMYRADSTVAWQSRTSEAGALYAGQSLVAGSSLSAGAYRFILQATDGNAVVYNSANAAQWSAGIGTTNATLRADRITMQADGNLVAYAGGTVRWQSRTTGRDARAIMQTDGNFVVYTGDGKPVWDSKNSVKPSTGLTTQQEMATTLATGRVRGNEVPMAQLRGIADGQPITLVYNGVARVCAVDPVLVSTVKKMVVDDGFSIYVTSLNRYCTDNATSSTSYHSRDAGGHAIDIGIVNGVRSTGGTSTDKALIRSFATHIPVSGQVGQRNCRATMELGPKIQQIDDTCHHVHLANRSY